MGEEIINFLEIKSLRFVALKKTGDEKSSFFLYI